MDDSGNGGCSTAEIMRFLKSKQGGETVDQKKIDKLYELMEQAEEELDDEAVAALRWAILRLEE